MKRAFFEELCLVPDIRNEAEQELGFNHDRVLINPLSPPLEIPQRTGLEALLWHRAVRRSSKGFEALKAFRPFKPFKVF